MFLTREKSLLKCQGMYNLEFLWRICRCDTWTHRGEACRAICACHFLVSSGSAKLKSIDCAELGRHLAGDAHIPGGDLFIAGAVDSSQRDTA